MLAARICSAERSLAAGELLEADKVGADVSVVSEALAGPTRDGGAQASVVQTSRASGRLASGTAWSSRKMAVSRTSPSRTVTRTSVRVEGVLRARTLLRALSSASRAGDRGQELGPSATALQEKHEEYEPYGSPDGVPCDCAGVKVLRALRGESERQRGGAQFAGYRVVARFQWLKRAGKSTCSQRKLLRELREIGC